jgi:hypothetical protein
LHFHVPQAFFIYDSYARAKLMLIEKQVPSLRQTAIRLAETSNEQFDENYKVFVLKMLRLREYIRQEFGYDLAPRTPDTLLLFIK